MNIGKSVICTSMALLGLQCGAFAAEKMSPALTWTAVDIVTNDYSQYEKIFKLAGRIRGAVLPLESPLLAQTCASIRRMLPEKSVQCIAIQSAGEKAIYVVQISDVRKSAAEAECIPMQRSSRFEEVVANERMIHLQRGSSIDHHYGEFINDRLVLDSNDPQAHLQSVWLSEVFPSIKDDIREAYGSCLAEQRASSINLMNYSGRPKEAIEMAVAALDDRDYRVRNASLGLLSSFETFIEPEVKQKVVDSACNAIKKESFYDKNKGLMVILSNMKNRGSRAAINVTCIESIRTIALHSTSEQLGIPAQQIIKALGHVINLGADERLPQR